MINFASDNQAGAHPAVLRALSKANAGSARAYGDDPWTARARGLLRRAFGPRSDAHLVLTGTAANVLALRPFVDSYHAVLAAENAHLLRHECAAPEGFLRGKMLPVPTSDGKLTPELLSPRIHGRGDPHEAQLRAISISQPTELGTVYTTAEIRALSLFAHRRGMVLHMDGARLANAAAALGVSLRTLTTGAGVDVLSFGGTKNGLLAAEAVVFFRPAPAFPYLRKQGMQLASKMRFIAVQFIALLSDGLWLRNATRANLLARRLEKGLQDIPGLAIIQPVQSNAVFARLPRPAIDRLGRKFRFYVWDERENIVRWMTSFDTRTEDVDALAVAARRACSAAGVAGKPRKMRR